MSKDKLIIYAGGTPGMQQNDKALAPMPLPEFEDLLASKIKQMELKGGFNLVAVEKTIDSSNASFNDWAEIGQLAEKHKKDHSGTIVIHGSDTLEYFAAALSFGYEKLEKPLTVVGSMLPLENVRSDFLRNLATAWHSTADNKARGVTVAFDAKLMSGVHVVKMSAGFDAIRSPHFAPLAKLQGNSLIYDDAALRRFNKRRDIGMGDFNPVGFAGVDILNISPGAEKSLARLIDMARKNEALIIEGYGDGNLPDHESLKKSLEAAGGRGVNIIIGTQVLGGVSSPHYEAGAWLDKLGALRTGTMTRAASYMKANYLLGQGGDDFAARWNRDYRSETRHFGA